jgi:hypothetical protein
VADVLMLHRLAQNSKSGATVSIFFYFIQVGCPHAASRLLSSPTEFVSWHSLVWLLCMQMCLLLIGPGSAWMDWMSFLDM